MTTETKKPYVIAVNTLITFDTAEEAQVFALTEAERWGLIAEQNEHGDWALSEPEAAA